MSYTPEQIAAALDLACLKPTATADDIERTCALANKHKIVSVCVAPVYVPLAASLHHNVGAVVGFPHGNETAAAKFYQAVDCIHKGAKELDVVVNYGRFLDGDRQMIVRELLELCKVAHDNDVKVKAILETCYYTPAQIRDACDLCVFAGVDWVKTSTGFGQCGATSSALITMLDAVEDTSVQVKASGGIKNRAIAEHYLDLGCTRLGSSRYLELLQ